MDASFEFRDARSADAEAITAIYNHFVATSIATFDLDPKSVEAFRKRIESGSHPWLVCVHEEQVVAYSHASPWKAKRAYERTVESTLYVQPEFARRGIGMRLYRDLLVRLKLAGVHTVLGGITVPNDASVSMHEKLGFERVGIMSEVGWKFDRWIDVEYWQKTLV